MNLTDEESPLYMEFDHPIPGQKGELRAVVAFVNRMKTDLLEEEFWKLIHELARFRREGGTFRDVIEFKYWRRKRKQAANRKSMNRKCSDKKGTSMIDKAKTKMVIYRIRAKMKDSGISEKDIEVVIRKARKRNAQDRW
jgi:hypothetical protein